MTSDRLARDYLRRAQVRRRALDALLTPGGYPDVVRGSQDLVELRDALDRLVTDRGPAFYGDEAEGIPASDLFGEPEARAAMAVVDRLLDLYERLLGDRG